jgi:hypothetical protein
MDDEVYLFVVEYLDSKGYKGFMAIYDADTPEECSKIFKKIEGNKSVIKKIKRMSEYDYKHMI